MSILRRLVIWALLTVFFASLVLLAYGWTINETFGRRETVKSWFEDSGAYDNFVTEIISVSQEQTFEGGNSIEVTTLTVAAEAAFPPELLQTSLEKVLDGTYDWLEGKESALVFSIDLTSAKEAFAENLTAAASERVENLPICETGHSTEAFDPFSAECRDIYLNFEPLAAEFKQLILDDEAFLPDPVIHAQNIKIQKDGIEKTIDEVLSSLPTGYSVARFGPFIAMAVVFLSGLGIVLIANSKRKGVFKLFRGFAFTAASLALFTYITSRSTSWIDSLLSIDPAAKGFTEGIVKPLASTATEDIARWTFRFMIIYGVLAGGILIVWAYLYKNTGKKKMPPAKTKKSINTLEQAYQKLVVKKPKQYKKSYKKRKEIIKKQKQAKVKRKTPF